MELIILRACHGIALKYAMLFWLGCSYHCICSITGQKVIKCTQLSQDKKITGWEGSHALLFKGTYKDPEEKGQLSPPAQW